MAVARKPEGPRKTSGRCLVRRRVPEILLSLVAVVLPNGRALADQPYRADDAAMAMIFSFREASQMHLLAHALGTASINGTPPEEVVKHCDRAIDSFEGVSVPMLRKYLANVTHDRQSRDTFSGITKVQQRVLAEMRAVKAMAESGNGQDERMAFVAANRAYNEIAQTVAASMVSPDKASGDEQAGEGGLDEATRSPNKAVFTNDEWAGVVVGLQKRGLLREAGDADAYFGTFALLKSVFVQKKINEPSAGQLFALAKMLNVAFGQIAPEKIETTLRAMLQLAKETDTEVASRQALLDLPD